MAAEAPFQHVVVVGPGAIGLCLAVHLAGSGRRVTLIDRRADRAKRLSAHPVRLRGPEGDREAAIRVRLVPEDSPDLVILATKAHAAGAAAAAAGWIGAAPVLLVQNGLGVTAEVARALPQAIVITAVLYQGANLVGEGEVRHVANLWVHVGYEGRPPDAPAEAVAALLTAAGLPARTEADMTPVVWGKLLVNAAINPVAALAGAENGAVAARPSLRALARALAEEGEATARAAGVTLPYPSAVEAALDTARRTAANRCSMLQDLEAGRPTEIDYLNGAIVRVAEGCDQAVPTQRAVAVLVRQVSAQA